ncbi:site-specific DNA-methyltransferase [Methanoregula sp.]|uniref:site-specific DNA-methyltransferase n=1 Tax=Methanoregula sp. TaxID=2052170 RepID=UPI0026229105|nr:site-specific DNA-methyltransferase [Methanoregula sp.]MDD5143496.1 site-specific DNA-methyltransferase [Methanoregula sp.]
MARMVSKLILKSKISDIQKEKLQTLFPEAFTEGKIDWNQLRYSLGDSLEDEDEHFKLLWKGKDKCFHSIHSPVNGVLKPEKKESVEWRKTENYFFEGDNLDILKIMQEEYAEKIKMIYIDPPYNTGKKFVYNDYFSDYPQKNPWKTNRLDKETNYFPSSNESASRYHSNWLNMMYPRLFLARNLLRDDGVIFISIDDHEVHNLRVIMDEIFDGRNFVEQIIWKKRSSPPNDKVIGAAHEYILVYAKNIRNLKLYPKERTSEQLKRYKNPDNHPKGPWTAGDLMANVKGGRYVKSLYFPITNPNTGELHYPSSNGNWRYNQEHIQKLIENNEIYFGKNGEGRPKLKRFLSDVKEGTSHTTIWDNVPLSHCGSKEMQKILGNLTIFDNPKPCRLIIELLKLGSSKNDIILDFFAGSCTTAHAVITLNEEEGGNRKFIMVQIPELTSEDSEAFKCGYKTVAEIGKERLRRVIKQITDERAEKNQKENNFIDSPEPFPNGYNGFKVYKFLNTENC